MSYYTDVVGWHRKFGVPVADRPTNLTPERMTLRCGLMHEEGREFWQELALPDQPDLAKVAKEAADVLVTVLGTMAELGIPFDAVWAEVMASNNSKADPDGTVYKRADGKVLKGSHYREADIASVLAAAATSGTTDPGGHILHITSDGYRVECREPRDADCRTTDGGCLVTDQAATCGDFAEDYAGDAPWTGHADGAPIEASWVGGQDGCYEWWYAERAA